MSEGDKLVCFVSLIQSWLDAINVVAVIELKLKGRG